MNQLQERLRHLIASQAQQNGLTPTPLSQVVLLRASQPAGPLPWLYEPVLIIAAQGKKHIYLNGKPFHYEAGKFLTVLMPMALECRLTDVSEEHPLLAVGIRLDQHRLAQLLLKLDRISPDRVSHDRVSPDQASNPKSDQPPPQEQVGLFTAPLQEPMLASAVGLLQTLQDPTEAAILGEAKLDDLYYRLLTTEKGSSLRALLRRQGDLACVAEAVAFLQTHMHEKISVKALAENLGMSTSNLRKRFKEVMQLSPLQYAKFLRLNKARTYLVEGMLAAEAAYQVGYNSPAQFSREYKRQFGMPPSEAKEKATLYGPA